MHKNDTHEISLSFNIFQYTPKTLLMTYLSDLKTASRPSLLGESGCAAKCKANFCNIWRWNSSWVVNSWDIRQLPRWPKRSRKKRYLRKISQSTLGFWWKNGLEMTGNSISGLEILFLIGDLDCFFCGGLLVGNMWFCCWSSGAWNMFVAPETCLFLFKKTRKLLRLPLRVAYLILLVAFGPVGFGMFSAKFIRIRCFVFSYVL